MKRPSTKGVIGVVVLLGLGLLTAAYVRDTYGTRSERRHERRDRAHQERMRELFKGAENVGLEEAPDLSEEKAADERLRRARGAAPSNGLVAAMPQ